MARGRAIRPNCVWPCLGAQIPDLPETATSFESAGLLRATHLSARQGSAEAARISPERPFGRRKTSLPAQGRPPHRSLTQCRSGQHSCDASVLRDAREGLGQRPVRPLHIQSNLSPAKIRDPGLSAAHLKPIAEIDKPISSPRSRCGIQVRWQSSTRCRMWPSILNPAAAQTSRSRANRAHLHTAHSTSPRIQ